MSMADVLSMISTVSYILAALFLVLSIFLWIKFKIPKIVGDLTGRSAKKSIAKMREDNQKTGIKAYGPKVVDISKGNTAADIHGKAKRNPKKPAENLNETGLLNESKADNPVERIGIGADTGVLDEKIGGAAPGDAVAILNHKAMKQKNEIIKEIGFKIIEEVVLIHTDEVIMYQEEKL